MTKLSLLALFLIGCGVDVAPGGDDMGSGSGSGSGSGTDPGFQMLIKGDWSLAPASEKYVCIRQTVQTDMYVKSIRPVSPLGTHHSVLMLGAPDMPDGTVDCQSMLIKPAIYASGVGTQQLDMPDGIAIHLRAGQQLLLNLHLFNTQDTTLTGTSGIEIVPADAVDDAHSAGVVLVGKSAGLVADPVTPPNHTSQFGTCTTPAGTTVFAIAPHMHLLGSHMTIDYNGTSLMNEDYAFDDQHFRMMSPAFVTTAGGKLNVECQYQNYTGAPVYFGESTTQEMCFGLTFVYPAPTQDTCTH